MMLRILPTIIAAIPLAAALPTFIQIPKVFLEDASCIMPQGYEVDQFRAWFPAAGNNRSSNLDFAYWDNATQVQTICHLNETSKNVALPGLAARYTCEDPTVEFIWQNNSLRLIERVCPQTNSNTTYEASGSVKPNLTCVNTTSNSTFGLGQDCFSSVPFLAANFTSLQPSPRQG